MLSLVRLHIVLKMNLQESVLNKQNTEVNQILVAVSGGFDPLHVGHLRMLEDAKALGERLVVIVNNDNWLRKKKGYVFMKETDRAEIIRAIRCVDEVILTDHCIDDDDTSVCEVLRKIRPNIFANGGDRKADNIPEYELCNRMGIRMAFNVGGGKIRSSSDMVIQAHEAKSHHQDRE